jgi:hypothetical protein
MNRSELFSLSDHRRSDEATEAPQHAQRALLDQFGEHRRELASGEITGWVDLLYNEIFNIHRELKRDYQMPLQHLSPSRPRSSELARPLLRLLHFARFSAHRTLDFSE